MLCRLENGSTDQQPGALDPDSPSGGLVCGVWYWPVLTPQLDLTHTGEQATDYFVLRMTRRWRVGDCGI